MTPGSPFPTQKRPKTPRRRATESLAASFAVSVVVLFIMWVGWQAARRNPGDGFAEVCVPGMVGVAILYTVMWIARMVHLAGHAKPEDDA